ncbi:MAG: chromate transporter, partial [Oscillospiraceae bacterium]|nr:chromate transporter [Oscillospiraceae bacterium]
LTTVGKSVPGVMITNVSMLVGYQLAGVFGGVLAVVGLTLPAIFILSLVTYFYEAIKTNVWFAAAMRGVNASVVAIIASTVWNMGKDALKDKITVLICGAAFLLCLFTGVSNILMIACGVLLALLWVGAKAVTERRGGRP